MSFWLPRGSWHSLRATANYMYRSWQCQDRSANGWAATNTGEGPAGRVYPALRLILYSPIFRVSVFR